MSEGQGTLRKGKRADPIGPHFVTTKNLEEQFNFHGTFRDTFTHQYRTSYTDHIAGNEICTKSTHPSGYSGHVLRLRHDIMFNGTEFDAWEDEMRESTERERRPDYKDQLLGLPTMTADPQGARKVPVYKTCPTGQFCALKEPWASTGVNHFAVLNYRKGVPLLPKFRPYELPPLEHKSGAVTARSPPDAAEKRLASLVGEPEATVDAPVTTATIDDAAAQDAYKRLFAPAPPSVAGELASTTEVLKESLATPRRPAPNASPARSEPARRVHRFHNVASSRAGYVLNKSDFFGQDDGCYKPSKPPRLPPLTAR
jgi:hypothetical protein